MKPNRPVAFAMGAITALVLGSGTAYAATGGKFILGKSNSTTSTTTLSNSRGTALSLKSKAGTPALKINTGTKVANLNADKLDGKDSSAFALSSGNTITKVGGGMYVDTDDDGAADTLLAIAFCPAGTVLTGGGGADMSSDGLPWLSEPVDSTGSGPADAWLVVSTAAVPSNTADGASTDNAEATAQCYDPTGAGASSFRTQAAPRTFHWKSNSMLRQQLQQRQAN